MTRYPMRCPKCFTGYLTQELIENYQYKSCSKCGYVDSASKKRVEKHLKKTIRRKARRGK